MPRPFDLHVDVSSPITNSTISCNSEKLISTSSIAVNQLPVYKQVQPSFSLLFSSLSRRDRYCFFIPAVIASLVSGGIAPFMTIAVGGVFNAFAQYPSSNPSQDDKDKLLHSVGISAIELLALAVGALVLSSVTSSLWISTGERNVLALRRRVYLVVTQKDMTWFDKKMGFDESVKSAESDGPMGAGGMMAQFAKYVTHSYSYLLYLRRVHRDTDDVRAASSLSIGLTLQYITTSLTALVIGFHGSWAMTLVVLATFPVLIFLGGLSQGLSQQMIVAERSLTAVAATLVDRAVAAIATVKAFNAVEHERHSLRIVLQRLKGVAGGLVTVWGLNLGLTQFFMMSMFVQAFWFGSKLVREGTITPGQVMTVFWACLIATSNLHMAIQQLVIITKGKSAMASIVNLIEAPLQESVYGFRGISPQSNLLPLSRKVNKLKQIVPSNCHGALEFVNVSFAYPSRPSVPVLDSVTMFFAPGDITFVVGGSGSGKSTVAQLLARIYTQQRGQITLDQNDMEVLDEEYTRQHIALVSQTCVMFDMSVHDNVAMGLAGSPSGRRPQDVTREEVMEACRIALMHEFVRDLPNGYDTLLGNGGANLSGGQKQRLAIARAYLRNPTVLILGTCFSAFNQTPFF
jgi:ATP-binding cassette subfamily B (MDR/TAP) protein 1